MSRPDRVPRVAVDFAPPGPKAGLQPVFVLVIVIAILAGLLIAVTQLLLR